MLKLSENPPLLSPTVENVAQLDGKWFVAQTKARAEKAMAWALESCDTGYFLPMAQKITFSGGRKRVGMHPLFSGYVFVNSDAEWWHSSVVSRHLARIVPVTEQDRFCRELDVLERALRGNIQTVLFPGIAVGQWYRITAGPLIGLSGVVVDFQGSTHVVLNISVLGQGAAIPVDASLLTLDEGN